MIRTLLHHPGGARIEAGDESLIGCWDPGGEVLLWADFAANDIGQTRELLIRQLRINPLAVSDALRDRHPPKLEWFDDYFSCWSRGLAPRPRASISGWFIFRCSSDAISCSPCMR